MCSLAHVTNDLRSTVASSTTSSTTRSRRPNESQTDNSRPSSATLSRAQRVARRSSVIIGTLIRNLRRRNSNGAIGTGDRQAMTDETDLRETVDDIDVSDPDFCEHRSHIGVSADGQYEWDNIPDTWSTLFQSVKKGKSEKNM